VIFIGTVTGGVEAPIFTGRRLVTSTVQTSIGGQTSIDDKTLTDVADLIEDLILAARRTLIAGRTSIAISADSLISIATETTAGRMPTVTKIAARNSIAGRISAVTAMTMATAIAGTFDAGEVTTATTVTSVAEAIMTGRVMIEEDRAVRAIRATLTATTDKRGGTMPPLFICGNQSATQALVGATFATVSCGCLDQT
jgi:hypothetical protein